MSRRDDAIAALELLLEETGDEDVRYALRYLEGGYCAKCGGGLNVRSEYGVPLCSKCKDLPAQMLTDQREQLLEELCRHRPAERHEPPSVVYYLDTGMVMDGARVFKIGRTIDLEARLATHRHQWPMLVLLATEPGGCEVESERHRQFSSSRVGQELFTVTDELLEHIDACAHPCAAAVEVVDGSQPGTASASEESECRQR